MCLGVQVESAPNPSFTVDALQTTFSFLFGVELALRFVSDRHKFLNQDITWNALDTLSVICSFVEQGIKMVSSGNLETSTYLVFRSIRLLRFLRVLRVIRMEIFRDLRLMINSMVYCVKPLTWAVLLMTLVTYAFAVVVTQEARSFLRSQSPDLPTSQNADVTVLQGHFSSMFESMLSLVESILGGADWHAYFEALRQLRVMYGLIFLTYIVFGYLAVLNVVTGIFVDSSLHAARHDKQLMIEDELRNDRNCRKQLAEVFIEADHEGSGLVSQEQLIEYLKEERVMTYMRVLHIPVWTPTDVINALTWDQNDMINTHNFVHGLLMLKTAGPREGYRRGSKTCTRFV